MLILYTPFSWGQQLICCSIFPKMSLLVGGIFFSYEEYEKYPSVTRWWWKLPDVCESQGIFKLGRETFVQFKGNFILDVQRQRHELYYGGQRLRCLGYTISFENGFPFLLWFCKRCINYASCIVTSSSHLHRVYVMSSSFPINTLL